MSAVHPEFGHDAPAAFALGTWSSIPNTSEKRFSVRIAGCRRSFSYPRSGSPLLVPRFRLLTRIRQPALAVEVHWSETRPTARGADKPSAEMPLGAAWIIIDHSPSGGRRAPAFG